MNYVNVDELNKATDRRSGSVASALKNYIKPVKLGNLELENNIFLAPLAGVTDRAFRVLCKEQGAGFVYSEMISAKGVHYGSTASIELAELDAREKPAAVQIFGSEPEIMAEAAKRFEEMGAAAIDINMGCPVPKVVGNGEGSALMKNTALAGRIIEAVSKAVEIPVTVKMRRGFNEKSENAVELSLVAEESGAKAVAVHGRYREEYYSGVCNKEIIRKVKEKVSIPVIASGDVVSSETALEMFRETGCDGIMIGRGALGNPWIFKELTKGIATEKTPELIYETVLRHMEEELAFKGEHIGVKEMRKHIAWYIKGMHGAAALKNAVFKADKKEELLKILKEGLLN
ncbi:MAG: tRNA dihydrouridine synthase DusB [Clostridia bacterium]|nr:tRNA dihydrouridine synthase DusB [Clostridia bacterium]